VALDGVKMKYYFSGSFELKYIEERHMHTVAAACKYRLQSLHGSYARVAESWCDACVPFAAGKSLMLDSGAYTGWKQGKPVKLHHLMKLYEKFLTKYGKHYEHIWLINLDQIPAEPGRDPTPEEITDSIKVSDKNYSILRGEFGDIVLPVYHQGESEERLQDVAAMTKYICVSPRNDLPEKSRVEWSKEVHHLLPNNYTHGLAATGNRMMNEVPWYSVDSAYWTYTAAMGSIFVFLDGKFRVVKISSESPERKAMGRHFDNMAEPVKQAVLERIEKYGFTLNDIQTNFVYRKAMSILEVIEFLKQFDPKPEQQPVQDQLFKL
jgi:hypothetical protein